MGASVSHESRSPLERVPARRIPVGGSLEANLFWAENPLLIQCGLGADSGMDWRAIGKASASD